MDRHCLFSCLVKVKVPGEQSSGDGGPAPASRTGPVSCAATAPASRPGPAFRAGTTIAVVVTAPSGRAGSVTRRAEPGRLERGGPERRAGPGELPPDGTSVNLREGDNWEKCIKS